MDSKSITSLQQALGKPTTRENSILLLKAQPESYLHFSSFSPEIQDEILDFLSGNRGLKILYNNVFQTIFNEHTQQSRLADLLSALLGQKVTIKSAIPREGLQISEKGSFVIMDILVELEDHSLLNLEVQKIGYLFPGERASCYTSDLIMRQYSKLRAENASRKTFDYHSMSPVHLLILMENSSAEFKAVAPQYMHEKIVTYSSGAKVTDLSRITYISLDTFKEVVHNNIDNDLHAWLTFLCNDDPEVILKLITKYPKFIPLYQEIAQLRTDPKELIHMYSSILAEMDHNTELYMIEEMKKELNAVSNELNAVSNELDAVSNELDAKSKELDAKSKENASLKALLDANGISYNNGTT